MKYIILSILLFIISLSAFSTEQLPDRLIINDDTLYIKSFPLEDLKFEIPPFTYYNDFNPSPHTGCWRGYIATWKVIDDRLMLTEVEKVDSTGEKLDILDYFKRNNYNPEIIDGFVFANWHTSNYVIYQSSSNHKYSRLYLWNYYLPTEEEPRIVFENGILIKNIIRSMDSFHIGDTITKEVSFYRHWLLKDGIAEVQAIIVDKNRKMVKIDVLSYGTDKSRFIKKVKQQILGYMDESYWVNPLYWK